MASAPVAPEASAVRRTVEAPPRSVNDLAIRVGTVNGSGSQSSNLVLLRALNHMGIPCSGKNIFPSNIEGLPTWFHLRASGQGYIAHRAEPRAARLHERADRRRRTSPPSPPGAVVVARDDFKEDPRGTRDDVRYIAVPFQRLVEEAYPNDGTKTYREKQRKVVNMVYVGVVAYVTGIEMESVEHGIRREFPGRKAKAGEINIRAARAGYDWAVEHLDGEDFRHRVARMDATREQDPDRRQPRLGPRRRLRRGQRADLVSDHPVEQPGRGGRVAPEEAPDGAGRQADLRRRAGRGRAGGRRHGRRRRLGRGAGDHRDLAGRASR